VPASGAVDWSAGRLEQESISHGLFAITVGYTDQVLEISRHAGEKSSPRHTPTLRAPSAHQLPDSPGGSGVTVSSASKPLQAITGSLGYRGYEGSAAERRHCQKSTPRDDTMCRA
jgi:hypothetical protein